MAKTKMAAQTSEKNTAEHSTNPTVRFWAKTFLPLKSPFYFFLMQMHGIIFRSFSAFPSSQTCDKRS